MPQLPYLTSDLPRLGGRIKQRIEDFRVDELPLYPPCGEGTHVYFRVRKRGVPTPAVVERIAAFMGRKPHEIGFAGLKDAKGVTTQMMSLEHADAAKLSAYRDRQVEVLETHRHTNKLRPGLLAGNRFAIVIRGVGACDLPAAEVILDVLTRRGVPNYFGQQRFGSRGDSAEMGRALIHGDAERFVSLLLGGPGDDDPPDCRAAREAFDAGHPERALKCWPRHYRDQRRALSAWRKKRRAAAAVAAVDKRMKRLYVSACQSAIFNDVLARRIETLDRVCVGDLAQKTGWGAVFTVEDEQIEQPRAERFEISPTGPIVGYRASLADGEPGRIEREVIAAHALRQEDFRRAGPLKAKGTRRALRFRIDGAALHGGADAHGEFLELTFTAPPGCYATVLLREILKPVQGRLPAAEKGVQSLP